MNDDTLALELGKAILTSYDGQHLLAQFDANGDEGTTPPEVLSPFGLDSRVRDPDSDADGNPGVGATALCLTEGRQQNIMVFGDPRATAELPTLEKGSARLYAHLSGNKVTWLRLDGATGSAKLRVPVGAGETTVEVDASTGDATITHQGGTVIVVKAASVELGAASGGLPLVKETPLMTWITSTLIPALAGAPGGTITVSPPAGLGTTKVNGT